MTGTQDIIQEADLWGASNYKPLPVVLVQGQGVWVWDIQNKKYLDCLSSYSALNHGHRHPEIVKTLIEQAQKITLTSRAFHNQNMGPLLKKLCQISGMQKALPMNTGVEAVETAIKAARKWGYKIKNVPEDKAHIIVCQNNFHGRTLTVVSFSSEPQYRDGFGPFTPGFTIVPYNDSQSIQNAITPNTVAVLIEPIQGEAGILIPNKGYLSAVKKICTQNNVLFILDEIQTGLGRTGKMFAYQHETDAKPDLVIVGKALGGGVYPVSAVMSSSQVLGVFKPGDHGSTFGGNPLGCAVAIKALELLESENLVTQSEQNGDYFLSKLKTLGAPCIKEVRGRGLLIAIEIDQKYGPARPYCEKLMHEGLLAKETHGQMIRLAPPLMITKDQIDWAVSVIEKVLKH